MGLTMVGKENYSYICENINIKISRIRKYRNYEKILPPLKTCHKSSGAVIFNIDCQPYKLYSLAKQPAQGYLPNCQGGTPEHDRKDLEG
jgi:hypothetical protein